MAKRSDAAAVEAEQVRLQVRAEVVRLRRRVDDDRTELRSAWSSTVGQDSALAEHEGAAMAVAGLTGFLLGRTTGHEASGSPPASSPGLVQRGVGAAGGFTLAAAGSEIRGAFGDAIASFVEAVVRPGARSSEPESTDSPPAERLTAFA